MMLKPDMSNYGAVVLSTEKYDARLGYGYDFRLWMLDDTAPDFFWKFSPLSTFIDEIAEKSGGKVTMTNCNAGPEGLVYFSSEIKDPDVVYDSFMKHLACKDAHARKI